MFKLQCGCGHKIAVPDQFGGKRIKCPRCQGPIHVPAGAPAAGAQAPARSMTPAISAANSAAASNEIRQARLRRHARESRDQSQKRIVMVVGVIMSLIALGGLIAVGVNNHYKSAPIVPKDGGTAREPSEPEYTPPRSLADTRGTAKPPTVGGVRYDSVLAGRDDVPAITTSSTYDAASGMTTMVSQPSVFSVADRRLTLVLRVTFDGKEIRKATRISAKARVRGDFSTLIPVVSPDEPLLTLDIDDKEHLLRPTAQTAGEGTLPVEVEYTFDRTTLMALARGTVIKTKMGPTSFDLTGDLLQLFRSFDPTPPVKEKVEKGTAEDEKEMEKK